ncbi:MAG TPA: hypothetical protein VLI54_06790 [Bacillota bacterium]|nr:hypothetical protein [Bacillota bacterium]
MQITVLSPLTRTPAEVVAAQETRFEDTDEIIEMRRTISDRLAAAGLSLERTLGIAAIAVSANLADANLVSAAAGLAAGLCALRALAEFGQASVVAEYLIGEGLADTFEQMLVPPQAFTPPNAE